jgi:hypothetical protein
MGSEDLEIAEWFEEKWGWAKAHPWKAALYAIPFVVLLPVMLLVFVSKGRRESRGVELTRADLEEKDRKLIEALDTAIDEIEEEGRADVFAAEKTARQRRLRATDQVVAERDDLAADGRALVEALRGDGRKDRE